MEIKERNNKKIHDSFWNDTQDKWINLINEGTIDGSIVNENFKISFQLPEESEEQRKNLETKAQFLIQILVMTVTVLTGIYGFFLKDLNKIFASKLLLNSLLALLLGAAFSIVVIGFVVIKVIKPISTYKIAKREDVFQTNVGIKPNDKNEIKEMKYKLFLSLHFWKVFEKNFEANEQKGRNLKKAYVAFILAFGISFSSLILLILYLFNQS